MTNDTRKPSRAKSTQTKQPQDLEDVQDFEDRPIEDEPINEQNEFYKQEMKEPR